MRNGADQRPLAHVTIIMPVRNEAAGIVQALAALPHDQAGVDVIVVDGQSDDGTAELAARYADRMIASAPGRARQMNTGLAVADGDIVLFLHADTILPPGALAMIRQIATPALPSAPTMAKPPVWGRFDVKIAGQSPLLPMVAAFMNLRSRLTGVATGDQAIFATRSSLAAIGGVPDIPIMEDIALSKLLRQQSAPLCLRAKVCTSGRRWDANGALRTIATMWLMRFLYVCNVSPARLARIYARLRSG